MRDAGTIVVGGGHAGVEAALAAARLGVPTLLVTGDPEKICTLPCNPSIGGSAKGQLVREIDALGGAMGAIADRCSLHARFLNESKGPSVRALRQQMDKPAYARLAISTLRGQPNLAIVQGLVEDLVVENGAVRGVLCSDGRSYRATSGRASDRNLLRRKILPRQRRSRRGAFRRGTRDRSRRLLAASRVSDRAIEDGDPSANRQA